MAEQNLIENKEQLMSANTWERYWSYLTFLRSFFKLELMKQKGIDEIDSRIGSINGFFNQKGEVKHDYPELEEIYFQIPNHRTSVRICITSAHTETPKLELVSGGLDHHYYMLDEKSSYKGDVGFLFLNEVIEMVVMWLTLGHLNDFGKSHFKKVEPII